MFRYLVVSSFLIVVNLFATINIAVATNVSYAMESLKKEFKKENPNIKLNIILGSSGKLTAQIEHNAPYDIFLSANMFYPNLLYKTKKALTKPKVYAKGSLVYFCKNKNNFDKNLEDLLLSKNIKKIVLANPKIAPYGKAALETLQNIKLYSKIKNKLIYAQSASQTLSYAITVADVGFVSKSAFFSSKMRKYKENIHYKHIRSNLYTPISQGIVLLSDSSEAKKFYQFILSNKAKKIFKQYGYNIE